MFYIPQPYKFELFRKFTFLNCIFQLEDLTTQSIDFKEHAQVNSENSFYICNEACFFTFKGFWLNDNIWFLWIFWIKVFSMKWPHHSSSLFWKGGNLNFSKDINIKGASHSTLGCHSTVGRTYSTVRVGTTHTSMSDKHDKFVLIYMLPCLVCDALKIILVSDFTGSHFRWHQH